MQERRKLAFAGIDIGAATAKAVILIDGERMISHYSISPTGHDVKVAYNLVLREALSKACISSGDLNCVFSTGSGRNMVSSATKAVSEIICHAKGAFSVNPATRLIIDIGGQDSKAIQMDESGIVVDFVMNDKCAAGTGRFLEVMASVLDIKLEDLGPKSLLSSDACSITSTCTVFAETEVVSLRAKGKKAEDLVAGIHRAIARRIKLMAMPLCIRKDVVFTGGVAKNVGMKRAIEDQLSVELVIPEEPQIIGALGAALLAKEQCSGEGK